MTVGVWAVNDTFSAVPQASIHWKIVGMGEKVEAEGRLAAAFGPDSSIKAGEVKWPAAHPGNYRLVAEVRAGSRPVSENVFEFKVQ